MKKLLVFVLAGTFMFGAFAPSVFAQGAKSRGTLAEGLKNGPKAGLKKALKTEPKTD